MALPAAPVARQTKTTAPTATKAQGAVVPFPIASLRRVREAFQTAALALGSNISSIEVPAAGGFLRWIELNVVGTTAGNAAAVAFNADAPFNVLSFVEFLPPSGDPPIVPHNGYQLYLWNKYGFFSEKPPVSDRRRGTSFTAVTGTGATGGSFSFNLRIPFEMDPSSGYGCITNSAANKSYMLNINLNTSAAVYSVAPTNAPTVQITGWLYYWDEPAATTRQGTTQETGPLGLGSFGQLRIDTPPLTPGDKTIKVNNGGPILRNMILVLRNASNGRDTADIPATWDYMFNTRDRFLVSDQQLVADMAEAYEYGLAVPGGNPPAADTAGGLDTGVRVFPYFNDFGGINPRNPRTQWQVTADATLTQVRGMSFGAGASTLEILTNLVRPTNARSLYPPSRIY